MGNRETVRPFSDIAVLCRTHRQLSLIERCLRHDDIPCVVTAREDFLEDDEVRGVLSFLRFLGDPGDLSALSCTLKLLFHCPADLIERAENACRSLRFLNLDLLEEVCKGYGHLEAWLKRVKEILPLAAKKKPFQLLTYWQEQYGATSALKKLRSISVFYQNLRQMLTALAIGEEGDVSRASGKGWESGAVKLMTLHAAKGLEFPLVFLAGVRDGVLPLQSHERPADPEEERRLFFVGITRAREELILTTSPEPSSFLSDLPQTVVTERAAARSPSYQQLSLFS